MTPARAAGYARALEKHSRAVESQLIFNASGFTYQTGVAAAEYFLSRGIAFDGLVAQSDEQAKGAMDMLLRAGKRVPQDVKIIGIDNSPLCSASLVSISSMSAEFYVQGTLAVDLLVDRIQGKHVPNMVIEPVLHARESTIGITSSANNPDLSTQGNSHLLRGANHVG